MSSVERRVRKLELVHNSGSRLIVVTTGADHKDGEVDALLAEKRIQVTDRDLVVGVRTRFDAKAADRPMPELLYVRDLQGHRDGIRCATAGEAGRAERRQC